MNSPDRKPPKDTRKERLAKQLRANLQRRKEQARERDGEPPVSHPQANGDGGRESGSRDA